MKEIEHIADQPAFQSLLACVMGIVAHLDMIASFIALVVLLFQLQGSYYNSKIKRLKYKKENRQ